MPVTITNIMSLPNQVFAGRTSTVGEPSVTQLGSDILATGNWYAGTSSNSGGNWQSRRPDIFFPSASDGFCCDQTSVTDTSRGLVAWILQYKKDTTDNTLRVAVKSDGDLSGGSWDLYDFTPTQVDPGWSQQWFDYNHVALSNNFLYVVTNMFDFNQPRNRFIRCVVFRLSLDALKAGNLQTYELYEAPSEYFSLRATEGAGDEMFFFAHKSTTTLTIFRWPEGDDEPTTFDVDIARWNRGTLFSKTPDGSNWLRRGDGRITAGWTSGIKIGALWMSNAIGQRPHPFLRSVCIDTATETLIGEPDVWTANFGLGYPSAGVNADGEVGVTFFYGGGTAFVNHAVGTLDVGTLTWSLRRAVRGTNGPVDDKWGDYLSCRPDPNNGSGWISSGFTLQGGRTEAFIQPHLVYFS